MILNSENGLDLADVDLAAAAAAFLAAASATFAASALMLLR